MNHLQGVAIRSSMNQRRAVLVVALSLLAGLAAFLVTYLVSGPLTSSQLLTITKPNGGTILGSGIRCGTRGVDCSAERPKGDPIELTSEADAGFIFVGYTGDCAPGGRTIMTTARICSATFVPAEATATHSTHDCAGAYGWHD